MAAGPRSTLSGSRSDRARHKPARRVGHGAGSPSLVRCKICHCTFQAITYTHLRYKHGIENPKVYKKEFSVDSITSKDVRQKISERKILVDRHASDYIRSHWGKASLKEITHYLGIHPSTVRAHAARLGLGLLIERWTESKVLRLLKESRSLGMPMNSGEARRRIPPLYKATLRIFGSWRAGLTRAGLPYEEIARRGPFEKWTRDRIAEEIRGLIREGMERNYGYLRSRHSKLYAAARNHFGNWNAACEAARSGAPETTK